MGVEKISIETFIELYQDCLIIDVRSEEEYSHAHIPSAMSIPLFNNEERKVVGTTYKQQSKQAAIKKGLDYFGPKMKEIINQGKIVGLHSILARITTDNLHSIYLNEKEGFVRTGVLKEAGQKFNRYLDVMIMQKMLNP
jgi:tRNA 2-selenouridine synthase